MSKIFSVPLNPKLTPEQYIEFYNFLLEYQDYIRDVYFTSRIPPFTQDAMGDIFLLTEDDQLAIDAALFIQDTIGIPISATFNNIQIPPTQQNLDIFISSFKPLYDKGVHIATIPHTHWLATGQIQKVFPKLYVKNTILRDVSSATEIVNLAKAGFNCINLDRDLMRDQEQLLRLKDAKKWIADNLGVSVDFSILANEGCLGSCPMMVEHFEYNNSRKGIQPQYFNDPISRISCPKWDVDDPSVPLKTANLPPWKADWEEFINNLGIDIIKMHGRESTTRLNETMSIIKRWANNEEILFDKFNSYIADTNLIEKPIDVWRKKIKTCKFECWECQYCDNIYKKKAGTDHSELVKHTADCIARSGMPNIFIDVPGLTSPRVQTLLNLLAQGVDTYLEVGSAVGATMCAVLKDNPIHAIAVDNWAADIQPENNNTVNMPNNNINTFISNINKYKHNSTVDVFNGDLFNFDTSSFANSIKMFFYDGPHDKETTQQAIEYYYPVLADESIVILDDANWQGVVEGTRDALNNVGAHVVYEKLMLNSVENYNEWWNGLYILVVKKS